MTTPQDLGLPLVKAKEGCHLRAYPDPASALYKAMAKRKIIRAYMAGTAEIPADLRHLDGKPWTIGYGETEGITEGMWWTQAQAEAAILRRFLQFLAGVYRRCPDLYLQPPHLAAACTSLAYNIGLGAFGASSVCRLIKRGELYRAADSFLLWNKAKGQVMNGLTLRRQAERSLFLKGL